MNAPTVTVNHAAFWESIYARGRDRWEINQPSPPLAERLRTHPLPRGRVAVLGCGRGHDARLLARYGHEVWGFDFATAAISEAVARAAAEDLNIHFEQRDIFTLATDFREFFDGIWEYTCFCAIDPMRRPEYVGLIRTILKPGGWYLACFWPLGPGKDGPPFPSTKEELRQLFEPDFEIVESYVPTVSVPQRKESEWMVFARLKSEPHGQI
jgi:SAM-dependent methyltransferase